MALLNTMTWALEADTVEYGEFKTGIRTEGATYAAFSFTRKVGQAVGAAIASYAPGLGRLQRRAEGDRHGTVPGGAEPDAARGRCAARAVLPRRHPDHGHLPAHRGRFREIVAGIQANRMRRLAEQGAGDGPS